MFSNNFILYIADDMNYVIIFQIKDFTKHFPLKKVLKLNICV